MLDIARVKELVGDPTMSDHEAEAVRDACIAFVELAIEAWEMQHPTSRAAPYSIRECSPELMSDD